MEIIHTETNRGNKAVIVGGMLYRKNVLKHGPTSYFHLPAVSRGQQVLYLANGRGEEFFGNMNKIVKKKNVGNVIKKLPEK